jgi:hypothetical protein
MFALNPGGKGESASENRQSLWFWGQLGAFFIVVRGAFLFLSSRDEKQIKNE